MKLTFSRRSPALLPLLRKILYRRSNSVRGAHSNAFSALFKRKSCRRTCRSRNIGPGSPGTRRNPQLYSRFLEYLISQKEYNAANQLIADYQKQFPGDEIFQVKAKALVEYRQGSIQQGLAVYEQSFQPLWDPELVKSYFDLLGQTQNLRKFLDESRAALNANPEDLKASARVFYYYQQQGKLDAAQEAINSLRLHKEAAKSAWTPQELYVCGRLLEDIHAYPEAARYYFALYNSKGANDSQERALSRLTDLLLTAPETPIRLGSGELSMYKDIATLDQGPGYLNGILSLILNSDFSFQRVLGGRGTRRLFFSSRACRRTACLAGQELPGCAEPPGTPRKVAGILCQQRQK